MPDASAPRVRSFAVVPPPAYARWILVGVMAIPAALWLVAMRQAVPDLPPGLLVTGALLALVTFAVFAGLQRRDVSLEHGVLVVRAAMFTRRVPLQALDRAQARVVDLREYGGLRPRLKLLGMALPGFHAGWFLRRGGGRGFYLTTTPRVLWLPVAGAPPLLLSLVHPRELIDLLPP